MPTPKDIEAAKERHPAGSKLVPKLSILNTLLQVVRDNYWLYGKTSDESKFLERWDIRSMVDYSVLVVFQHNNTTANKVPDYANFYYQRNVVMGCLINAINDIRPKGTDMIANYGDWRFWETDGNRTKLDIERVIAHALDFEARAELSNKS